ncbi:hypothetical protein RUND412_002973 [Rhizina undulata]
MTTSMVFKVFRIKGVPAIATVACLEKILRAQLSEAENHAEVDVTFVPSCYWDQRDTKWALVDFQPIPQFLHDVAQDKTESKKWHLQMGDSTLVIDVNFYGFTQLYQVKGTEVAAESIVAVTGLGGHAYGSWRGKQTKKMWLRDFLAQDLPNCRTMIYGYNTNLNSRGIHTLNDYKIGFLNEIAKIRKSEEEIRRPIIFIGHSFGGIVIAHSLVEAATRKGEMEAFVGNSYLVAATCAVLFFGTPHGGILMEDVSIMLEDQDVHNPRIKLLEEIKNKSNLERDLNKFKRLAEGFKVVSFYERLQTAEVAKNSENIYTRSGNYKSTVETDSALLHLPKDLEDKIPVNSDHTNIVKFDDKLDETYGDVIVRMQKYIETATANVKERFGELRIGGGSWWEVMYSTTAVEVFEIKDSLVSKTSTTSFPEHHICIKLPFRRNPKFCGRADILEKLKALLQAYNLTEPLENNSEMGVVMQGDVGQKTAVLHGMGGAGKSQIALEFAYRFSHCYTSIFWIDADNVSRTADSAHSIVQQIIDHYTTKWRGSPDYSEIANILGIPGKIVLDDSRNMKQIDTETAMKAVHNWLGKKGNQRWLLLIDNHDNAESELDKLIPMCDWGSVVVTTRLPELNVFGKGIEIEGIGSGVGLELLLGSSGKKRQDLNDSELGKAQTIVRTLCELPLALDQAGAYIRSFQTSFSDYQEKLKKGMKSAFRKKLPGIGLSPEKASVLTTWELSFQALSENARHLLHMCAFLSNEDIPDKLFHRGKSAIHWIEEDENNLDDAIQSLFSFSLAKRKESSDSFYIHPLVHAWAREHTDSTVQRQNALDTITLVGSAYHYEDEDEDWWGNFKFRRRILTHLELCRGHISESFSETESIKAVDAWLSIASAFEGLGYFEEARDLYFKGLQRKEKALGMDDVSTLRTMDDIARFFADQKRYDESLEWNLRLLERKEMALGNDNSSTLGTMSVIANLLAGQKRYDEAQEWFRRFMERKDRSLGEDHALSLQTMDDIARVFADQKRYDEAQEWYRRLLERKEKALGQDNPSTLDTMDDIARIFAHQKLYDEALEWHLRLLERKEKAFGKDNPSTLRTMDDIARFNARQIRYDVAIEWFQKLVERKEKALGKDDLSTLSTMDDIACNFSRQKRYDEALDWFQRVVERKEKTLGKDDPSTLSTMNDIAYTFARQERYDEAQEWHLRLLERKEKTLGLGDPSTFGTMDNIARIFAHQKRYDKALEWHLRLLERKETALGNGDPSTLRTMNHIAEFFAEQKYYGEAQEWYRRLVDRKEKALGKDDSSTLSTIDYIAQFFAREKRYDEALEWHSRLLERQEQALGKDDRSTLQTIYLIARIFADKGRYDEAMEWFRKLLERQEKVLGKYDALTLSTVKDIADVFRLQREDDEVMQLEQQCNS